ncbi:MAG: RIP metalloprotease RseP [Dysgonamonadaceae bacterium]|jgi:regulator of sigma E protease|nr:RIP metalloprotease RseP [Dysgonamonadaceae bacterium]
MDIILIKAVQLILSLSILVIIHECGHFFFAKIFKVRVEKFYLFFNPWFSLFKYKPKWSETEYGVGWVPLGGYVKISGMIDESMDKEALAQPPQPWEFRTKSAWQRLLIMVGGVLMNFILAFLIYSMMVFAWGEEYVPVQNVKMGYAFNAMTQNAGFRNGDIPLTADGMPIERMDTKTLLAIVEAKEVTVLRNGEIVAIQLPANFKKVVFEEDPNFIELYPFVIQQIVGNPAKDAGLQVGDSLIGINGVENLSAPEIHKLLAENKEKNITLNLYRENQLLSVPITPNASGKINVGMKSHYDIYETVRVKYNFITAFPAGIKIGIKTIKSYLSQFKYIFSKEGAKSVGGFGAIGNLFPERWNWAAFWNMTAFLSIILGVMNLLPIPALDGGHVMFLLYEVVSGRKPNEKLMEYAQITGMIFLLALLLYANGNDIFRFLSK